MSFDPFIFILSTMVRAAVKQRITRFRLEESDESAGDIILRFHGLPIHSPPFPRLMLTDLCSSMIERATEKTEGKGITEIRLTVPDCPMHNVDACERYTEAEVAARIFHSRIEFEILRIDARPIGGDNCAEIRPKHRRETT